MSSSMTTMTMVTLPTCTACTRLGSPESAKKSMKIADDHRDEDQGSPERPRDDALRAVQPVLPGLLAVRGLVQPLAVRRLLGRRLRLDSAAGSGRDADPRG